MADPRRHPADRAAVSTVGQLRVKDELVIIVTPRILDDEQGGSFGYGYRAGTPASRQLVQSRP